MISKSEKLAALDAEFDSATNRATGRLKVAEYLSRRDAIEAEPADPSPASEPGRFITMKFLQVVLANVAQVVREQLEKIGGRVAELDSRAPSWERVARLEARIEALERNAQKSMRYLGVWHAEDPEHQPGDVCTDRGTIWFCREVTNDRPGTSSWQLMLKHTPR